MFSDIWGMFSYFFMKMYDVCTQSRRIEALLMSTLNILYFLKNRKNISKLPLNYSYLSLDMALWLTLRRSNNLWLEPISMVPKIFKPFITKTNLYNFDPIQSHFYIVKLGFTGLYIIFLISAQKYRLWIHVRTDSVLSRNMKNIRILSENYQFWWWNIQYIWTGVFS